MSWPNKIYSRSMVPIYTRYNDTNMLFRYSGVKRAGTYLDSTINGNNSVSATQTNDAKKGITAATNRSVVSSPITGATVLPRTQSHSMGSFVDLVVPTAVYVTVFGKGVAGAWSYYPAGGISITNAGIIRLTWFGGGADYTYADYNMGTLTGKVKHLLYVIDHATGFGYLYINGFLAVSNSPTTITNAADYVADPFKLFASGSTITNSEIGISLKDCTLWSRALTAADVRKEWLQYARMVQLKTGWGSKVSIANENTVGNFIGNGSTPFEILSGTWKVSTQLVDGELHKVIECVASGTAWLDRKFMNINSTEASYGSWRLSYGHAKDTVNVAHIGLTSTNKAAWDAASNTGYVIRMSATAAGDKLLRYSGGGAANLCFNMPNSAAVTNQIHITRRFDNSWQGYHMPNIVTSPWTPSTDGPFVDSTYTTSAGMSFTFNAGDWVSLGNVRDAYALTKYLGEFDPREV